MKVTGFEPIFYLLYITTDMKLHASEHFQKRHKKTLTDRARVSSYFIEILCHILSFRFPLIFHRMQFRMGTPLPLTET
ncbi:MAG: hypothetical protein AAGA66_01220 [Bacteroidota bacterium]